MADWIKVRTNLWDDPRVTAICDALDRSEAEIVGGLIKLWSMADSHTEDGTLPSLTPKAIDRKVGIAGFANAVVGVGWLSVVDGGVSIPRFGEHNGKTAKTRAEAAKRMAALRGRCAESEQKSNKCEQKRTNGAPSTSTRTNTSTKDVPNGTSPPKSPKGGKGSAKGFDPVSVDLPPELDRDSFRAAWVLWCDHRREIGKPLTPQAVSQQLAKLAKFGVEDAVAKIETAVANGWQGVVFPDSRGSPQKPATDKFAGNRKFLERYMNASAPVQPVDGAVDGDGGQALLG